MDTDWKWFHPTISRIDCEHLLENTKCGTFLVRKSESSQSDLVLSLSSGSNLFHYRIKCSSKGLFLDSAEGVPQLYFSSCNELVEYYKKVDCGLPYVLDNYVSCVDTTIKKEKEDNNPSDDESEEEDEIKLNSIAPFFRQQLCSISAGRSDETLQKLIKEYVEKGVDVDWQAVHNGATEPSQLQILLTNAAKDLQVSLQLYLKRLKVIKELFAFGSEDYAEKLKRGDRNEEILDNNSFGDYGKENDLVSVLDMLNTCQTDIFKLQQKAYKVLKETGREPTDQSTTLARSDVEVQYSPLPLGISSVPSERVCRGEHMFEVTSGHLKNKSFLLLHVIDGKFFILKSKYDELSATNCYNCDKVLQLVKSKSYRQRLTIVLEGQGSKQYTFQNYKSRELFCQRMQQMKIAHSTDIPSTELSVFIGSWNMGDTAPPNDITEWYKCLGLGKTKAESFSVIPSDIFAIGTQESAFQEKEWITRIKTDIEKLFEQEFKLVASCTLWGIRLVIFIKSGLMKLVNSVKQSTVRTGIANTLGNKGAAGISFNVGTTSFCFVNCHLTSGIEKMTRRNQNFHAILRGLDLGQSNTFDILHSFHHFFWLGDLNYRIELEITEIIKCIMENDWHTLIASDQLNNEIKKGNAFLGLEEEDLTFRPTYRYTRGTRSTYVWTKQKMTGDRINVPSWCDRVLWKSYPYLTSINTAYGCTQNIVTSDHSPVFASFDVSLLSETLSSLSNDPMLKNIRIDVVEGIARVLSSSCTQFILEFHSNCFEKTYSSRTNSYENYDKKMEGWSHSNIESKKGYAYPWWVQGDLFELIPIIHDPNYLKDQHLLISVKGSDGQESYGECVVSLQPLLAGARQTVEERLTHLGVETGYLRLVLHLRMPEESNYMASQISKVYELISVADEETNSYRRQPSPSDKEKQRPTSSIQSMIVQESPNAPPRRKKKEQISHEFHTWLKMINLDGYYQLLVDNGYDDLEYFCSITTEDLEEVGILNEEHRNQIVQNARNLKLHRKSLISV